MTAHEDKPSDGFDPNETEFVHVCESAEVPPGERTCVELNGIEVGIFNIENEYYAIQNNCPHRNGPVCEGKVMENSLEGDWPGVGSRINETLTGEPSISCPWHGWEFDLDTGVHLGDESKQVPAFEVTERDGELYIQME